MVMEQLLLSLTQSSLVAAYVPSSMPHEDKSFFNDSRTQQVNLQDFSPLYLFVVSLKLRSYTKTTGVKRISFSLIE